ncbi:MAG: hypothetical protein QOH14_679 [Pseudonocardiales bacterium]|nr:hypothetical protein [Pseudonocardiales bacterium]
MKIAVIGVSGWVGGAVAREALSRGHSVTAVAPDASQVHDLPGATVAVGDVLDADSTERVVAGHDAVLTAVTDHRPGHTIIIPKSAEVLLEALPRAGVERLVFAGGGSTLEASPGVRFLDTPGFPESYREEALAHAEALQIFRSYDGPVRWSYASPPPVHLLDGRKSGAYRVQAGDRPVIDSHGESRITVSDYASALVDELERGNFIRQRFTVGY